jgi:tetratricopeptide (TPR) repeat protein
MSQGRAGDLRELLTKAAKADPNNGMLTMLLANCERRIQLSSEVKNLEAQHAANPNEVTTYQQLLGKVSELGDVRRADVLVKEGVTLFPTNVDVLRDAVNYFAMQNRVPEALGYGRKLEKLAPEDAEVKFGLAKFSLVLGNRLEFYKLLKDVIRLGGLPMREKIANEPLFQRIISEPDFQAAIHPPGQK